MIYVDIKTRFGFFEYEMYQLFSPNSLESFRLKVMTCFKAAAKRFFWHLNAYSIDEDRGRYECDKKCFCILVEILIQFNIQNISVNTYHLVIFNNSEKMFFILFRKTWFFCKMHYFWNTIVNWMTNISFIFFTTFTRKKKKSIIIKTSAIFYALL